MTEHSIEYERPIYYDKQYDAVFDPRRYSVIEASTKAGKTSACIGWLLERALGGEPGHNYWWVAPVSDQARIAFTRMQRALPRGTFTANLNLMTLTLFNGTAIWFKSGDRPDGLYGEDVYACVVDEASRFKMDAWHAIRTTLTATKGPVRVIGNVKGRRNWFYALARRAQAGDPDMGYHKLTAADAVAAGVLEQDEIEDARRLLPERVFRELYLAEASDDEGNPFGIEAIQACVAPMSIKPPALWGWDFAKSHDWSVGVALDVDGRCCRFERFQAPWSETMARVARLTGRTPALADSTGVGDPIVEMLARQLGPRFEGYHFHQASKQKLMEGLAVAIQSRTVSYPAGVIPGELGVFEYQYSRTGGVSYSAPEGFYDDCVCALALAVEHRAHAHQPLRIPQAALQRAAMPPWPGRVRRDWSLYNLPRFTGGA
jgi:hypothetical protein